MAAGAISKPLAIIVLLRRSERTASMHMVKSVGVMSVAKIMGLIYGCLGLIFMPLFLLIGVVGSMAG